MQNFSNLEPIKGDGKYKTWIDIIPLTSLRYHDEYREGYDDEDEELCYAEGVGYREVDSLLFVLGSRINFCRSGGRGGDQSNLDISSDTLDIHINTNFNPSYMMDVWLELKLN